MRFLDNIMSKLYAKSGTKIKQYIYASVFILSVVTLILGALSAVSALIVGIVCLFVTKTFMPLLCCFGIAVAAVIIALALCPMYYLVSLMPYGLGQLVENSQKLVDIASRNDAEKRRDDEEKLADLEAEKKARLATLEKARREVDEKKVQTEAENIARIEKEQNDIKAKAEAKALQAEGRKIIEDDKRKEKEAALWEKNRANWEAANERARKMREEMDREFK